MTWRVKTGHKKNGSFRYLDEDSGWTFFYGVDRKKGEITTLGLDEFIGKKGVPLVERDCVFQRDHAAGAQDFDVNFRVIDGIPKLVISELDETLTKPLQEVFLPIPFELLEYSDPAVDPHDVLLQAFYKTRELSAEIETLKQSKHVLDFALNPGHDGHKVIDFIRKHGVKESSDTFKRSEAVVEALMAREAEIRDQITEEAMLSLHKELDFFFTEKEIKYVDKT